MEIFELKCKHCGKKITSLYQKQAEYNLAAHEISCPRRKNDKNIK